MSTQVDLRTEVRKAMSNSAGDSYTRGITHKTDASVAHEKYVDAVLEAFADYLEGIELPEKHSFDSGILSPNETAAFNEAIDQTHTIINSHVSKLRSR